MFLIERLLLRKPGASMLQLIRPITHSVLHVGLTPYSHFIVYRNNSHSSDDWIEWLDPKLLIMKAGLTIRNFNPWKDSDWRIFSATNMRTLSVAILRVVSISAHFLFKYFAFYSFQLIIPKDNVLFAFKFVNNQFSVVLLQRNIIHWLTFWKKHTTNQNSCNLFHK